jgi:hypothetical protein
MWFGSTCLHAGIPHHVDTTLVTPHLMTAAVDESYFVEWKADHPEAGSIELIAANEEVQA